jgi:protein ImuA
MPAAKSHIIAALQKEILLHSANKQNMQQVALPSELFFLKEHFPLAVFPLAAIHEFVYDQYEDEAATNGFISGLLSSCITVNGVVIWISLRPVVFPSVLKRYNIEPEQVIFIHPANEKELLWVTEEALKCEGLRAVVSELSSLSFHNSRRFQLAVEKSKVTGFVLSQESKSLTNACVSRWKISCMPSELHNDQLPGVGFPKWKVELKKMRNGKPGEWEIEWMGDRFRRINSAAISVKLAELHQQTG